MPTCSPARPAPTTTRRRRWGSSFWEIRGLSRSAALVELVGLGLWSPGCPSKEVGDAQFREVAGGPARPGRRRCDSPTGGPRRPRGNDCQAAPAAAEVGPEGVGAYPRNDQEDRGFHAGAVRGGSQDGGSGGGRAQGGVREALNPERQVPGRNS